MLEVQFCSPWNVDIKSRLPIENPSSRSRAIPLQSLKSYPLSNLSWKMAWNGDGWTRDWAQPSPHFPRVKTLEEPPRRHQNYSKSSKNASLLGWTRGFGDGWTQIWAQPSPNPRLQESFKIILSSPPNFDGNSFARWAFIVPQSVEMERSYWLKSQFLWGNSFLDQ